MLAPYSGKLSLGRSRSPSLVPPTKELEEAISNFETSLSEERRKQFQLLKSTDDSYDTNAAQLLLASVKKAKDSRFRSRALLKIQGFLEAVQEFSAIVDSIAAVNPIAGAVWGGVKLFMVYAIKFTHFIDDLTTCLNQVQSVCPRFKAYGTLYQGSQELKQAICDYYALVFRFITRAISELEKSGLSATWSYIKSPLKGELSDFKDDLTKLGENVNLYVVFAKSQADANAQEAIQKHNILVRKAWNQLLKREQEQRLVKERNSARSQRHELLKRLSDHEYKRLPKDLRKKALYGPEGPWLLQTSQYKSWTVAQGSATFLLSGKLGSGKSVLSTEVLDDILLQHSHAPKIALCFFFCDARQQKESSLKAKTILSCLCRQYLQQSGDLDTVEPALCDFFEDNSSPDAEDVAEFFVSCVDGSMTTHIMLDGLDDCNSHEIAVVLTALRGILRGARQRQTNESKNIKLFISFSLADDTQLNKFIKADYQQHTTSLEASVDFTQAIDRILQEKKENGKWRFEDEDLFVDVSHALHQGSQNMLLWASLMIDEICAQHRITDVRNLIQKDRLPKDLHGVYGLALERIEQTKCQNYAAKMFHAVAAARRPISLPELAEIVVIEPCQPSWNPEDRIAVPEDMISWVANLLILDDEDRTVSFTHHSVVSFLTVTQSSIFQLDLKNADIVLGKTCVTYLNVRELQGQLVPRQEVRSRPRLHPVHLASTAISSAAGNQSWTRLLTKMALKVKPVNHDKQRRSNSPVATSVEILKAEMVHLQSVFYLLAYASEFWLDHSSALDHVSEDLSMLGLWKKLLISPIPAASRPWDPEPWNDSLQSLNYAIESHHVTLFKLIWKEQLDESLYKLSSDDAALLLKAGTLHQAEEALLWSAERFWQGQWESLLGDIPRLHLLSKGVISERLLELRKSQGIGDMPAVDPRSRLGNLVSAAILAAIANDYTLVEIERLSWIIASREVKELPFSVQVNYLSAAAASNRVDFIDDYLAPDSWHNILVDRLPLSPTEVMGQAIVFAALYSSKDFFKKLLATQAARRMISIEFLQVALMIFSFNGDLEGVILLFEMGDGPWPRGYFKKSYFETLLERPRDFLEAPNGKTPLMAAAMHDHRAIVVYLLTLGAWKDTVDIFGKTAFDYAKSKDIRRLLDPMDKAPFDSRQLDLKEGTSDLRRFQNLIEESESPPAPT